MFVTNDQKTILFLPFEIESPPPFARQKYMREKVLEDPYKELREARLRLGFMRKVYGILCCQLLLTLIMCAISMSSQSILEFQREKYGFLIACLIIIAAIMILIMWKRHIARTVPNNYIALLTFTFAQGYLVSFICAAVDSPKAVLMAAFLTLGVTLGITLYVLITVDDFTYCGASIFIWSFTLLISGLMIPFINTSNDQINLFYSILSVIIYGYFLVFDTQAVILADKMNMDDYIISALLIYMDIILLFLRFLRIVRK